MVLSFIQVASLSSVLGARESSVSDPGRKTTELMISIFSEGRSTSHIGLDGSPVDCAGKAWSDM